MRASAFRLYSILGQLGVWTILLLIFSVEEMDYSDIGVSLAYGLCKTLVWPLAVYPHYYGLLPMLQKGRIWLYCSLTLVLLFFTANLSVWVDQVFPFSYDYDYDVDADLSYWGDVFYYFLLVGLITAVSSLYYFIELWQTNQERSFQLRQQKLEAELNFLKSQINPHFLFNSLNNVYVQSKVRPEDASESILLLSDLLRYQLYDCAKDKVSLQ